MSRAEMALVTGGAVRLGKAIALALAAEGYAIGLHYHRSRIQAEETAREIEKIGRSVYLFQADLRDPEQIKNLFNQIITLNIPLKILVNSASTMMRGNLRTMVSADWDNTLNLNLRAPWLCARAAAGLMGDQGGVIINISDTGARKTWTGFPAYVISKAGLETLTKLLAREFAPKIRVNAVAPGLIIPAADMPPEEWARLVHKLPAGHSGSPRDITQAILFLIQNQYIIGEVLVVDGGYQNI